VLKTVEILAKQSNHVRNTIHMSSFFLPTKRAESAGQPAADAAGQPVSDWPLPAASAPECLQLHGASDRVSFALAHHPIDP
jgi:hypothetical protein